MYKYFQLNRGLLAFELGTKSVYPASERNLEQTLLFLTKHSFGELAPAYCNEGTPAPARLWLILISQYICLGHCFMLYLLVTPLVVV